MIKPQTLKLREYQKALAKNALNSNTLIVLPTGLGKTIIAVVVAAYRLKEIEGKILMLAPSKPLINQHFYTFSKYLNIDSKLLGVISGLTSPEIRDELWRRYKVIFSTPQTVRNDLLTMKTSLKDYSLVVFDEAHRAVGSYPYVYIADRYMSECDNPLILGLTATPGDERRLNEICRNLLINKVEYRSRKSSDVAIYVPPVQIEYLRCKFTKPYLRVMKVIREAYNDRLAYLRSTGISLGGRVNLRNLIAVLNRLSREPDTSKKRILSLISEILKLHHLMVLIETQGVNPALNYLIRLEKDRTLASRRLLLDHRVSLAYTILKGYYKSGMEHPKVSMLKNRISEILIEDPNARILVFVGYRDTVKMLYCILKTIEGCHAAIFVGQQRKIDSGLSQKEQMDLINRFREGEINTLIATNVAEEGLDLPEVEYVFLYDSTPSEIRYIQRKGRTGRVRPGHVIVLIGGLTDEIYLSRSIRDEKRMDLKLKNFLRYRQLTFK